MKYPITPIKKGPWEGDSAKIVINSGDRNGVAVRRNTKQKDYIELKQVFKIKGEDKWTVQNRSGRKCTKCKAPIYGGAWFEIGFPTESLPQLIECLQEIYGEIYGDTKYTKKFKESVAEIQEATKGMVDTLQKAAKKDSPKDWEKFAKEHGIL